MEIVPTCIKWDRWLLLSKFILEGMELFLTTQISEFVCIMARKNGLLVLNSHIQRISIKGETNKLQVGLIVSTG